MTVSRDPLDDSPNEPDQPADEAYALPPASATAMQEYFQLQQNLLICTLVFTAVIFFSVWSVYSLNIALNYLLGACTGVVYLRMLAKSVAEIGRGRQRVGSSHMALFIGLMIVATQWNQLQVLPVFLGFLTYKAALIAYTLWTSVLSD